MYGGRACIEESSGSERCDGGNDYKHFSAVPGGVKERGIEGDGLAISAVDWELVHLWGHISIGWMSARGDKYGGSINRSGFDTPLRRVG